MVIRAKSLFYIADHSIQKMGTLVGNPMFTQTNKYSFEIAWSKEVFIAESVYYQIVSRTYVQPRLSPLVLLA